MDSWLVAAAAAAGYFATHWQKRERNEFPEFSVDSRIGKAETGKCPFRKLACRKKLQEDVSLDGREILDGKIYGLNVASAAEMDSASGFDDDKVGSLGNHTDAGSGSNCARASITRMNSFNEPMRKRSSLKTKYSYGHLLRPISALDSCLMAQLYMQHVKMEEYILSSLPSPPTPMLRPLLITDGSRIISRASCEFSNGSGGRRDNKLHSQATFENSEYVFGIPPLPKIKSLNPSKKLKFRRGNGCAGRLSIHCKMDTEKQVHSQLGPCDGAVLFCLGISIGIISSYIGNRREVEKLRGLLNQTENLVQDLQEELEMKDSLTVKELVNEKYESQESHDNSFHFRTRNSSSLEHNLDNSTRYVGKESYYEKIEESSESMSKIEAELEAELERLGLNMNVSNVERRLSDLVEELQANNNKHNMMERTKDRNLSFDFIVKQLDPDFVADFAEGELRSDMVSGQALAQSASNEDRSGTSTTHSENYAVSPRELSLRLHEVIQSRLEERIQELETALQNSHSKVRLMESEHKNSWNISKSELKYSSNLESPLVNEFDAMSKPLVMNLSGEALDAYNEACEELLKVDESEEEDAPSDIYQNNHQEELFNFNGNLSWGDQNGANGSILHSAHNVNNTSEEIFSGQRKILEEQTSRVQELFDASVSEDEFSDCDDEMEKQLIQQIVEKTKKGSPLLLNAQRILFSVDEI